MHGDERHGSWQRLHEQNLPRRSQPAVDAGTLEALENSGVEPNTRRPYGVFQRNISSTRKYTCSEAMLPMRTLVMVVSGPH
jgi:hypothetical protein